MAVELSAAQLEAVQTFGMDLCVSAGAGSGKTLVLVNRFIEAVTKQGCVPEEILALTFTEKAANVMKVRLVQEFLERGLHAERRAVENAYIGTIHSFCARLLRENPIEAGIDPYFIQLSKGESDLLMAGVLDRVFEMQAARPLCLELLVERGEENVRQALLRLYAQYRALGEDGSILKIMDGSGRKDLQEKLLRSIRKAAGEVNKKDRAAYENAIVDATLRLPELLKRPLDWTVFSDIKALSKSIHHVGKKLKEWDEEFKACIEDWLCAARQELYLPHKTEFIRVFSEFHAAYESEKRARAVVDFDDLPILAIRLLSGKALEQEAVRRRYQARFRNLFVDEFQDTSPLQARLIELLRGKKNLFLVGDRQQSIYAFRYAEPELFARYEKVADKLVRLSENFRSRAELMEWVNGFFAASSGEFQSLKAAKSFCLEKDAMLEILRVPYGESEKVRSLEEAREAEAELIAARIEELVRLGERTEDKTSKGRPMRWGDAAILLRGRRAMPVYERALARRGIPFYSARSQGFFETPEVKDLIHFLVLLDHEENDVALAAVLRSPLVAISDDGLFWVAQAAKKNDSKAPLWKAFSLSKIEGLSAEDMERIDSFAKFLARMRASKNRFTVSAALDEALRQSGYEARTLASPGGLQKVANARKLVDIARSIESQTPLDAAEFVRTVRGMEDGDESEARIEGEDENAVLISTIHAAKGLEFPAVFLANLGAKRPPSKTGFCLASRENGFGWAVPDDEKSEKVGDTSFTASLESLDRKRNEEEDRLLYVAMTRAEEKLVLCGAQNTDAKKESTWMARILAEKKEVQVREVATSILAKGPEKTSSFLTVADAEKAVARLTLPVKTYTLALDLTVSDLTSEKEESFVPSEEPEAINTDDPERSPRNEFGTIFHRAMELSLARKGVLPETIFSAITAPLTTVEKKEIHNAMERFWKSDMGNAVKKSPKCYPELSFIYKTKKGLLKGQLDLVFRNADEEWVILDYKTNRFSNEMKKQDLIETYRQQLGLYALAFWKVYGKIPARTALYFTQTHESIDVQWSEKELQHLSDELEMLYLSVVSA